ncbi:response regulator transcription factor [Sulfurospirillum oryzae]|uniref:response regulator transcription factor n=1 Tax=Sulfurospirillum oryzae TaxID=2976535 RepID=UPI0021E8A6B4|nr:response regulator transcription factor [Sulfurospirillum oryzae]
MNYDLQRLKNLTVLVAEDDTAVLNDMAQMLSIFFKEVLQASNGEEAFRLFDANKPDMVLSDIQMPLTDGVSFAKKIRMIDATTPILFISSYSEGSALIQAVNCGVDGYIVKPIELEEVLQAISKSLRRTEIPKKNIVYFKNALVYNYATKVLTQNGLCIDLGAKEHALLSLFLQNRNRTLTKKEIVDEIWSLDEISDSAFKSLLTRLRKKIGEGSIENDKNNGWRLVLDL